MKNNVILCGIMMILGLMAHGCAVNPVTGEQQLMLLSESQEIQLGKQTDSQISRSYGLYEDEHLQTYLESLGQRLARVSHRPGLTYRFKVLDSPVVNAFAVPGGYIYVTRGILAYLNNEAELAGVLGHEIGHVTARHSAHQYSRAQLAQIGLGVGSVFSETFGHYAQLAQFGVNALFLRFSRDNERQADDLGVEYASRAGFAAEEMADFFYTLERLRPEGDKKGLPTWLSTHPDPPDRIFAVRQKAREWKRHLGKTQLAVNQEAYLNHIDDLVFGEDPRQGYEKDGIFFHPGLKFSFPVPENWKLFNTTTQVKIISENQQGAMVFAATRGNSPRDMARQFVEKSQVAVLAADPVTIHGLSAYRVVSQVATQQGIIQIMSTFINKEDLIYVFHGYTAQQLFQTYASAFRYTEGGFKTLTDPDRLQVTPDRIGIRRVGKSGSLRQALSDLGVPGDKLKDAAIMNGKQLEDPVDVGHMLKIVVAGKR